MLNMHNIINLFFLVVMNEILELYYILEFIHIWSKINIVLKFWLLWFLFKKNIIRQSFTVIFSVIKLLNYIY